MNNGDQQPMSLVQLIGFLVSMVVFLYLSYAQSKEKKRARQAPEEDSEDILTQFLKSVNEGGSGEIKPMRKGPSKPPPPLKKNPKTNTRRVVDDQFRYETKLDAHKLKSSVESRILKTSIERGLEMGSYKDSVVSQDMLNQRSEQEALDRQTEEAYALNQPKQEARVNRLLRGGGVSKKSLIILHDVIGKPKGVSTLLY